MEKLDGPFETVRIHNPSPDHVSEALNTMFVEFLDTRNVFFVIFGVMKFNRHDTSAIAWAVNMKKRVFSHRFSFFLFAHSPDTGSGPIVQTRELGLSPTFRFRSHSAPFQLKHSPCQTMQLHK